MQHGIKTLFLLFTLSTLLACSRLPTISSKGRLQTIAFYNTGNFFDTTNDPQTNDDAYTPTGARAWTAERYQTKLKHIARVISGIGGSDGPAVIGLGEIESRQVLEDLVNAAPLRRAGYGIIHQDMPDAQGLDVALLYQPKLFKPTQTETFRIDFGEKGFASRDVLQVKGELRGEPVTIYVVHWPEPAGSKAKKAEENRLRKAATVLRQQIDKQQTADENVKIVVLGDFGTEPRTPVMQEVLKATGRPNPSYKEELFNTHFLPYVNGLGSYANRNDLQMPDQILISKALLNGEAGLQYVRGSAAVHDPEEIKFLFGKYKDTPIRTYSGDIYIGGYSDHFPVYIQVRKER
ncbi:endonuclease/exonuclease/phosphatase family protein [Pontibacter russatus]|uniref:endonuclease/exonuclease/phosphatase family protein n=1 Tax=Pontibacter russatus TaxID=2694929 RepID=UPI00137A9B4B|nr:endonuclease/exonuclease/phosphatase family protein [Pontibacter russatus]